MRTARVLGRRWVAAATLTVTVAAVIVPGPPAQAAVTTFTPVADTYVQKTSPKASFGAAKRISADNVPVRRAFLKFQVDGLPGAVTRAKLRIRVAGSSKSGGTFRAVSTSAWDERTTWNTQPAIDGEILGSLGAVVVGEWAEVDVTKLVTGNGTFSVALTSSNGKAVHFDSRESGAASPQLVVSTDSSNGDPVLVGVGDISSCFTTGDTETAALLDAIPGTVFTVGDSVYPDGALQNFTECYDPAWGRFKDRTRPVPGNHEYRDPGAAGYFDYYGAIAGERDKGYYSYDLGEWHIVVLNSNCEFVACAAGSLQEQWLRADLMANPRQCSLAMWHHPLFTSGANHQPRPEVLPLYQALYDHGVEVVLSGHNHHYERFAPQDPAGVADSAKGVSQFVAGMGGSNHYAFTTIAANSVARNNDTFGVLKLNLHPGSYEWEFVPVAGKTYSDYGTAACH